MTAPWSKARTNASGGRVTDNGVSTSASTSRSGGGMSRKTRIFLSYAPDWCLTIALWGLFYLLDKVNGYRRLFDITDTSLAHPHADPERVPVWLLAVLCGIVPAVIIVFTAAVRRSFWDAQSGLLGLILALALVATFTNIIKITVGRPRPDFFDRCILPEGLTENPLHGLTSWTVCTQTDDSVLQEGFRSFPSGHSSFAWSGMWYLILYLAAKMRINNRTGYTYKSWLLLAPLSCCSLITISRTMDYRHHATDVIAGSILGILGAWYSYRQYYPALSHPQAYKPFSPRIPKDEIIPMHSRPRRSSIEGMLRPSGSAYESHHHTSGSTQESAGTGPVMGIGQQVQHQPSSAQMMGYDGSQLASTGYGASGNPYVSNAGGRSRRGEDRVDDDHGEADETVQRPDERV
ncbi:hypothetical protein I316_04122 [Kwoniella heveanensis BCC8398]|uniref:Phosphatidic acid phosphatase type 2/haloperoxidase domain-containing protein n=1 Tax=Kwoniella heveanensis BCC8398 TaxID=1296120 RepID=A0A1B9GSX3_9TREE|nr:hypothetical protein I316_04122 [Kwoniella heveanensis BCC8398]